MAHTRCRHGCPRRVRETRHELSSGVGGAGQENEADTVQGGDEAGEATPSQRRWEKSMVKLARGAPTLYSCESGERAWRDACPDTVSYTFSLTLRMIM